MFFAKDNEDFNNSNCIKQILILCDSSIYDRVNSTIFLIQTWDTFICGPKSDSGLMFAMRPESERSYHSRATFVIILCWWESLVLWSLSEYNRQLWMYSVERQWGVKLISITVTTPQAKHKGLNSKYLKTLHFFLIFALIH